VNTRPEAVLPKMELEKSQVMLPGGLLHCESTQEDHMQYDKQNYTNLQSMNEYFIKATLDYWTAISFPALYFAKYL